MGVQSYNSQTGRFLSTDPIYGGNANPYDYCSGDPINCTDISGAYSCKWINKFKTRAHGGIAYNYAFRCDFGHYEAIGYFGFVALAGAIVTVLGVLSIASLIGLAPGVLITAVGAVAFGGGLYGGGSYLIKCKKWKGMYITGGWYNTLDDGKSKLSKFKAWHGAGCR
jgi:hypothetical protein